MRSESGRPSTPERDRLIEAHLPLARKLARRYQGRGESLDDLVQVGALGLIRASDRFDPDVGVPFGAFASRVIDGEIRRHLRARVPGRAVVALEDRDEGGRHGGEPFDAGEARALLLSSVGALDERERRIVFLRFQADLTEGQIGSLLGISQAQVSRRLHRALEKLRAELEVDISAPEVIPAANGGVEPTVKKGRTVADKSGGYSGRFLVRMPGELHEELARSAAEANVSLNRHVTEVLAASTVAVEAPSKPEPDAPPTGLPRAARVAIVANIGLVILAGVVAVLLLVFVLQHGV